MNGRRRNGGGARNSVYVSFVDHSSDQDPTEKGGNGVDLPNRDLILIHAACTSIIERSGSMSIARGRMEPR